jgi:hypothetical protein
MSWNQLIENAGGSIEEINGRELRHFSADLRFRLHLFAGSAISTSIAERLGFVGLLLFPNTLVPTWLSR